MYERFLRIKILGSTILDQVVIVRKDNYEKVWSIFFDLSWNLITVHLILCASTPYHSLLLFSQIRKRERERDRMIVCMREREREVKLLLQCFVSVSGGENEPEIHRCCCISKANHLDLGGHRIVQISKKMVQDHQNDFKQFSTTHTHTLYLYLSHTHTHTHTL